MSDIPVRRRVIGIATWVVITAVLAALAWHGRGWLSTELTTMLPDDDPGFRREVEFFATQGAARIMAVEGFPLGDGEVAAVRHELEALIPRLAPLGARPLGGDDPGAIAHAASLALDHLPELIDPRELEALVPDLAPAALDARLTALKERASRPDDLLVGSLARSDLLGLAGGTLRALQLGPGGATRDGALFVHADGRHLLLTLEVDFDPGTMSRTDALMDVLDDATTTAAARGVRLEPVGSYRHFRDNLRTVRNDLTASLPLGAALIIATLWSLLGSARAVAALHVPALLGMLGAFAAVVIYGLIVPTARVIPLPVLGFASGLLGVTVDYATHYLIARRAGHEADVRPLLGLSFLTTGLAFAALITSGVPGLRTIGVLVLGGLATGLAATLWLLPLIAPTMPPGERWTVVCGPLLRWSGSQPRRRLLTAGLITLLLAPGLWFLDYNRDLRKFDGSRPETWQALETFMARWGGLDASTFLVAEDADPDRALAAAAAARTQLGLPPSLLERVLPDRAEQERRHQAWNAFWTAHGEEFTTALREACTRTGLAFRAFTPTIERYRPTPAAQPVTLADWQGTPLATVLAGFLRRQADGNWEAASPVAVDAAGAAELRQRLPPSASGAWVANRSGIGNYLIEAVRADLASRATLIACVVVALMIVVQRNARRCLAVLLPPALALTWTFGTLGWCGMALTPFALLAAAFIGGIGIDSAIFLASRQRASALAPVLNASLTTVLGVGSMMLATHPIIRSIGVTLTIGMSACLVACLLITPALTRRNQEADPDAPSRSE